ncbi:hypothetical protein N4R57_08030 [Rhodobacteraceae bacterium D3-12]|nr:hypothetical protein N4R57_08030 [Rhodobacteraceae bacterium D3-12]
MLRLAAVAVGVILSPSALAAENPLKPGDYAIAVRQMVGGKFTKDASGKITGRRGYRILQTPAKDYAGTCWQVKKAKADQVDMCLVSGVFKPHWEDGTSYTEWCDAWSIGPASPFPTDLASGTFSVFQRVASCPGA